MTRGRILQVNECETVSSGEERPKRVVGGKTSCRSLAKQLLNYQDGFCYTWLQWKEHVYLNSDGFGKIQIKLSDE